MKYGVNLQKVQKIQIDILKRTIDICDENNIEYFIIAGTALGAVRHGGFIPWDDDIDIGMKRHHYEKFLRVAQSNLGDCLFLQTCETDPNSPFYFAKVRKKGTKFVEYYCRGIDMNHGIFVDIFPYDNLPDNFFLRLEQKFSARILHKIFVSRVLKDTSVRHKGFSGIWKRLVRWTLHYLTKPIPKEILLRALDKKMKMYNKRKTKLRTCLLDKRSVKKAVDDAIMYPLKEIRFEGISVSSLNRTDILLEKTYGDYMRLPPEEERGGDRPYELDLG